MTAAVVSGPCAFAFDAWNSSIRSYPRGADQLRGEQHALIIGDEILSGKRADKHLPKVIELLGARGLALGWEIGRAHV